MKTVYEGVLYLSGGGDSDKTKILDYLFLEGLVNKNILFIPIAKSADMNGYKKSQKWLMDKFSKLTKDKVSVSMILNLNECEDLNNFSAIYIGGGNTYKLLKLMKEGGFFSLLKKYIKNGGIMYGASAGTVLMGNKICTLIEEKYIIENKKYDYKLTKGMNLIGSYSIVTHYKEEEAEKVQEYFKNYNNPIIAIPEGEGLIVKSGKANVAGDKGVTIFRKDYPPTKIEPSKVFVIY